MNTRLLLGIIALLFSSSISHSVEVKKTIVDKSTSVNKWTGKHSFTYQWVSLDKPGALTIENRFGLLVLNGDQKSDNGDSVHIDGNVVKVSAASFSIYGRIESTVAGLHDGKMCKRKGVFDFIKVKKSKKKTVWRLKQKGNPCDPMGLVEDVIEITL